MVERMGTYTQSRLYGKRPSGGFGATLIQSCFRFFLRIIVHFLCKLMTLNLRFSGICVNTHTHTHTHNSGALYYKLFSEYQRVGVCFSANLSLIYHNILFMASCSRQNRIAGAYPSAASTSEIRKSCDRRILFFSNQTTYSI